MKTSARRALAVAAYKIIRRAVDETHELAERAIQGAAADRAQADDCIAGAQSSGPTALHALCLRLIDERDVLAKQLEGIRLDVDYLEPRTRNVRRSARRQRLG